MVFRKNRFGAGYYCSFYPLMCDGWGDMRDGMRGTGDGMKQVFEILCFPNVPGILYFGRAKTSEYGKFPYLAEKKKIPANHFAHRCLPRFCMDRHFFPYGFHGEIRLAVFYYTNLGF
jgi:hypothetical protein